MLAVFGLQEARKLYEGEESLFRGQLSLKIKVIAIFLVVYLKEKAFSAPVESVENLTSEPDSSAGAPHQQF